MRTIAWMSVLTAVLAVVAGATAAEVEKTAARKPELAVSMPDDQGRVVVMRPVLSRQNLEDPIRLVLHVEQRSDDGERVPITRTALATVPTLQSLRITIKPPRGEAQTLRVDTSKLPQGVPHTTYAPTLVLTLHEDAMLLDTWAFYHPQELRFRWVDEDKAELSVRGVYQITIRGEYDTGSRKSAFAVGPVKVERGAMGLPSEKELMAAAREQIATAAKRPELKEAKKGTPDPWVFEDDHGRICVLMISPGEFWSQQRYYAAFDAQGEPQGVRFREVGTCVAEDTSIETANGPVPVQKLRVGERIWGFDLQSRKRVLSTVIAMRSHIAPAALKVDELRLTANHPIYANGAFLSAGDLAPGDALQSSAGAEIRLKEIEQLAGPLAVYDITVDGVHNYFADGLLVHNKDREWWPHVDDPYYVLWPTEKYLPAELPRAE